MSSEAFLELVRKKLREEKQFNGNRVDQLPTDFGITEEEKLALVRSIPASLRPVVRKNEADFDLVGMLAGFKKLWEHGFDVAPGEGTITASSQPGFEL